MKVPYKYKKAFSLIGLFIAGCFSSAAFAVSCGNLVGSMSPPVGASSLQITSATVVMGNDPLEPTGVDHCRVEGIVDVIPSDPGRVKFLMRMPLLNWNGKTLQTGVTGFGGQNLQLEGLFLLGNIYNIWPDGSALGRGYTIVTEDGGHDHPTTGSEFTMAWALDVNGDPPGKIDNEREINFGGRSIHLAKLAADKVTQKFYNAAPSKAYYIGCSTSGWNGWNVMNNYPHDFDGMIVEGSYYGATQLYTEIWHQKVKRALGANFTEDQLAMVSQKVLQKCDHLDGVVDGILSDPKTCTSNRYDPIRDLPICLFSNSNNCITLKQALLLEALYFGPVLLNGHGMTPSSEAPPSVIGGFDFGGAHPVKLIGWTDWMTGGFLDLNLGTTGTLEPYEMIDIDQYAKFMMFDNPQFNTKKYIDNSSLVKIASDIAANMEPYNMNNYTLTQYKNSGGKVIILQGWVDPIDWAEPIIALYDKIANANGGLNNTKNFARLFMKPGVGHCFDGTGPQLADTLTALDNWVVHNQAPEAIPAFTMDVLFGGPLKSRPLCSYPKVPKIINPSGNIWDASNFNCQ